MGSSTAQDILRAELQALSESAAILRIAGEIDMSSIDVLSEHLEKAASAGCSELVIDASNVTFMDSTGVHALIEGKRLLHQAGSKIALVPSRQVRCVLGLTFPEPLFAARLDTVDEALSFLGLDGGSTQKAPTDPT